MDSNDIRDRIKEIQEVGCPETAHVFEDELLWRFVRELAADEECLDRGWRRRARALVKLDETERTKWYA